jgi:O-antigen/teichoic acid export membrane protein
VTGRIPSALAATAWAYAQGWTARGLSLLIFFLLARLLGPQDFGAFAIASIVLALSETVMEQGLAAALIQRERLRRSHLDSAFWGTLALGAVLTLLAAGGAQPLARWFDTPAIAALMFGLAPVFLLMAAAVVPVARLRRQLDYKRLAQRALLANLLGGVAALAVAARGGGAWAFVANQWVYQLVGLVVLWSHEAWRPRFYFGWSRFGQLFAFSGRVTASKLLDYVEGRALDLFVARSLGLGALGQFAFANRSALAGQQLLAGPIWDSSMGILSRLQSDRARFNANVVNLLRWAASIAFPPLTFVIASAPALVPALFGAQWLPSVLCLQLLLALALLRTPLFLLGVAIQAWGEPRISLRLTALRVGCVLAALALLPLHEIGRVAAVLLAAQLLSGVCIVVIVRRLLGIRALTLAGALALPLLFCAVGGAAVLALQRYSSLEGWPLLLTAAAVYALLWCALVLPFALRTRRALQERFGGGIRTVGDVPIQET